MASRGAKLRQLRVAKGLRQKDVAAAITEAVRKVSIQTICDWETKDIHVAARYHRTLAELFEVPFHQIAEMYATKQEAVAELRAQVADLTALAEEMRAELRALRAEVGGRPRFPEAG